MSSVPSSIAWIADARIRWARLPIMPPVRRCLIPSIPMHIRHALPTDHGAIREAILLWWTGSRTPEQARELSLLVPPLFLQHFGSTSWIIEDGGQLVGFLIGFHSADHADQAYIHFVGVDPRRRGQGV